jgi:phage terminase small subunit
MKTIDPYIQKTYEGYDDRVLVFMSRVYEDVKEQNTKINNYFYVTLDLLANQLLLYFRALDAINADASLSTEDSYKRQAKSPQIAILNHAHQEIIKILDDYGLSPFASAKIKRLNNGDGDQDAEELLDNLVN